MRQGRFKFDDEDNGPPPATGRMSPASVGHVLELMAECIIAVAHSTVTRTAEAIAQESTDGNGSQPDGGQR